MNLTLTRKGHRVLNASNAGEAMKIAKEDRPLLILTDLELPTFGQLLRDLEAYDHFSRIPVVIVDIDQVEINEPNVKVVSDFDQLDEMIRTLASSAE